MLEFTLTLAAGSVPFGLIMRLFAKRELTDPITYWLCAAAIAGVGFSVIFAGTLWGVRKAAALNVQSAWKRVGLMVLGWLFLPCLFSFGVGICAVVVGALDSHGAGIAFWPMVALVVIPVPCIVLSVRVEMLARKFFPPCL